MCLSSLQFIGNSPNRSQIDRTSLVPVALLRRWCRNVVYDSKSLDETQSGTLRQPKIATVPSILSACSSCSSCSSSDLPSRLLLAHFSSVMSSSHRPEWCRQLINVSYPASTRRPRRKWYRWRSVDYHWSSRNGLRVQHVLP